MSDNECRAERGSRLLGLCEVFEMLGLTSPLFKYRTTIARADAEEAKAVKRFEESRSQMRELNNVMSHAARVADSVARLGEELRHLR